jgi:urocanate hydratase
MKTSIEYNKINKGSDHITLPFIPEEEMIRNVMVNCLKKIR